MEWLQAYWRWIVFFLMVLGAGHWLTNTPDMRHYRLRVFIGAVLLSSLVFFLSAASTLVLVVFAAAFMRLAFTLFGYLFAGPVADRVSAATVNTLFGSDEEFQPGPRYTLERHHRSAGRSDLAIEILERKLKEHPNDFEGWYLLAGIYAEDKQRLDKAEACVRKIFDSGTISPKYQEFAEIKLREWREQLKGQSSASPEKRAFRNRPAALPAQKLAELPAARQYRANKEYGNAIKVLRQFIKKDPGHFEACMLLAAIYAEDMNDLPNAEKTIQEILQAEYQPSGYKEVAKLKWEEWKKPQGKLRFEPARLTDSAEFDPASSDPMTQTPEHLDLKEIRERSKDLARKGLYGSAVDLIQKWLTLNPEDFEGLLWLAEIHAVHCRNLRKAERIVDKITDNARYTEAQWKQAKESLNRWRDQSAAQI